MNLIRLLAFVTGLVLVLIGLAKRIFGEAKLNAASYYTPAVLITIGVVLIFAVRKK